MTTYAGFRVTADYDPNGDHGREHHGIDLATPNATHNVAPYEAILKRHNDSIYGWRYDVVEVGGNRSVRLAHLSRRLYPDGARVKAGTFIAETGGIEGAPGAGNSQGPHEHIEVRVGGVLRDPENYPELLEALFIPEEDMPTAAEIRNLIEYELGQAFKLLGGRLQARAQATSDPTARLVIDAEGDIYRSVGEDLIEQGSK